MASRRGTAGPFCTGRANRAAAINRAVPRRGLERASGRVGRTAAAPIGP
ncbi:MAG: hypothetical protein ABL993_05675 [Vicinamibacterales bacterium]